MSLSPSPNSIPNRLTDAVDAALRRIPPLWPLQHFVAVNPFLGLTDQPFPDACALLERVTGAAPLQSWTAYRAAWENGTIRPEDLAQAADARWTRERLLAMVNHPGPETSVKPLRTVADALDQTGPRVHWGAFVVEEISKWCAAHFDGHQSTWRSPWQTEGLYRAWKAAACHDGNPEAFGLAGFRSFVTALPGESEGCIRQCVARIAPPDSDLADFFHRQLATLPGWAGYAQYRVREDALRGRPNTTLRDLLAIRLAYDAALLHAFGPSPRLWADAPESSSADREARARWQLAYESGYQRQIARQLAGNPVQHSGSRPAVQAVFCIDVRSEVLRRHLEAAAPGIQTLGFAGFFGFPVAHRPTESGDVSIRCPALLVPPFNTCEPLAPEAAARQSRHRQATGAWKAFQNSAASCFSFVESFGLVFGARLAGAGRRDLPRCSPVAPRFAAAESGLLEERVALAEGALRNMSLTSGFARLVLFCGHGSQSANNPHASGLDCGACGGHAGDVNARLAAATLNDPRVRQRLRERGIVLPADTVFLAGMHHTTTDEVSLFDVSAVPESHLPDLQSLQAALQAAGAGARQERAPSLGLGTLDPAPLLEALCQRARDIAQVRPEWGLANNAALIVAPRGRTSGLDLQGRAFLHDYDTAADPEGEVLTLILCAPVVVASWINLQYYASRVDPERYGSGDKVLHQVTGGLGVVEGNAGDLKVGLPLQSIHDGQRFVHEPRRLSVFIEAPRSRISAVLAAQSAVRQLFDHGWIHLLSLEGNQCHRYTAEGWTRLV
ncbi:MAG: DUF2309 domain-containing protein [Verrucomicrobia bacterium]|nr:DUF2309 domain-containing protein [Verrucomicrobiota bacterium]